MASTGRTAPKEAVPIETANIAAISFFFILYLLYIIMILLYQDTVVCETLIDITTESVRFPYLQDIVYNIITTMLRRYVC